MNYIIDRSMYINSKWPDYVCDIAINIWLHGEKDEAYIDNVKPQ